MELEAENYLYHIMAGLISAIMFLPEFFFGMRIIVDLVLVVDSNPNPLVVTTRALLAAVCFGFAMLLLHFFRSQQVELTQGGYSPIADLQIVLDSVFIFFAIVHLLVSMLILGLLSYRLIMDVPGISFSRCTAIVVVIFCTALQGEFMLRFINLPTRPFSLLYVPLIVFQLFLWVYRDFFHVSPMAFDVWVLVAMVLFLLDVILVLMFTLQRKSEARVEARLI